jgi:glutamate-1-semialdehyde 2,1-aminomutase
MVRKRHGNRIHGGAQSYYGITPDLATFGKAVAAGVPLSVVAERREIMEQLFDGVAFGSTFNGNPVSLAGAHAALEELGRNDGQVLRHANATGLELIEGIRRIARARGVNLPVSGFGAAFCLHFTTRLELRECRDVLDDEAAALRKFLQAALAEGIHCLPDGRFYLSAMHSPREVEETLQAIARIL